MRAIACESGAKYLTVVVSPMHKNSIPLYNLEGRHRRYITQAEADDYVFREQAEWRCGRCGRRGERGRCLGSAKHKLALYLIVPERRDGNSPCAITKGDMEANVGIAGDPNQEPDKKRVAAAQDKIGAWLETFDSKAPCIGWLRYPHDDRSVQVARA